MKCEEGIMEVFVVRTSLVDFFGALIKLKHGAIGAHGRVRFAHGNGWYFHIPRGNMASLRNKLVSASRDIAEFYSADVFHEKFQSVIGYEDFNAILSGDKLLKH